MRLLLTLAILALLVPSATASETTYLYKAKLVQAAPGKLLEVIDLYKASLTGYKDAGDELPLAFRFHVSMCGSLGVGGHLVSWGAARRET